MEKEEGERERGSNNSLKAETTCITKKKPSWRQGHIMH